MSVFSLFGKTSLHTDFIPPLTYLPLTSFYCSLGVMLQVFHFYFSPTKKAVIQPPYVSLYIPYHSTTVNVFEFSPVVRCISPPWLWAIVLAIATTDALGASAVNIGKLLNTKNIYFVPFGQDDPHGKNNSLISDFTKIPETIEKALNGEQLQPILLK